MNEIRAAIFSLFLMLLLASSGYSQGVVFQDVSAKFPVQHTYNPITNENGGGLSFYDFNQDGFDDLVFSAGPNESPKFFVYDSVQQVFQSVNLLPGHISDTLETETFMWGDYDNDGDPDLFIGVYDHPNFLLRNDNGQFTDVTSSSGLYQGLTHTFTSCWTDYNLDGLLDLFVGNRWWPGTPQRNYLYKNNGDGTFTDVAIQMGVDDPDNMPLAASFVDINNDLYPDLYLAIDKVIGNVMFLNEKDSFRLISDTNGTNLAMDGMSVASGDYDNDGRVDLYVTNNPYDGNALFKNLDGFMFSNQADTAQVLTNLHGWGSNFFDYDLDGDLDLLVCNSAGYPGVTANCRNPLFENNGNGSFNEALNIGIDSDTTSITYGSAIGDYNNDGCPDVAVLNNEGFYSKLYQNSCNSGNHWLKIDLVGTASNRDGIGAWITVIADTLKQHRYTVRGSSYASTESKSQFFGLKGHQQVDSIYVWWPSGLRDTLYNIGADQRITITEQAAFPDAELGPDTIICSNLIRLSPKLTTGDFSWKVISNKSSVLLSDSTAFSPTLVFTRSDTVELVFSASKYGTTSSDTIRITYQRKPELSINIDSLSCGNEQLFVVQSNAISHTWQNILGNASVNQVNDSTYSISSLSNDVDLLWNATLNSCSRADSVQFFFTEQPQALAGTDQVINQLQAQLQAVPSVGNGFWYSLEAGASFFPDSSFHNAFVEVNAQGSYDFVWTEINQHCSDVDTVNFRFENTSSVFHNQVSQKLLVYPNPLNQESCWISSSEALTSVIVYNELGHMIFEMQTIPKQNRFQLEFPTQLTNGLYTLKATTKTGTELIKKLSVIR